VKSQVRLSGKNAHLRADIGDTQKIHQSQHGAIEDRQHRGSAANAHQRLIFFEGGIATPVKAIFNGTITNDKFCMSRVRQMQQKPAGTARRDEIYYPSVRNETEQFSQEETHETTAMDGSALHQRDA